MKICIDISQISYPGTGTATYTRNIVSSILKRDINNNYLLFGSSLRRGKILYDFASLQKTRSKIIRLPQSSLDVLWNKFHFFSIEYLVGKIDVFHTSDWLEPPSRANKLTTIHDLVVYVHPEFSHPKIVEVQKRKLEWVRKESKKIIAVSQSTKQDLVERLKIDADRIEVVYEAASERYKIFNSLNPQVKKLQISDIKKKYSLEKNYILAVGTREPRKNLSRLISAFNLIKNQDIDLVIVGKTGWGELNVVQNENVKFLGYVPDEELPALYSGAKLFCYPSLYEGFGLPVVEAMSVGCPVITSNVSSLPEVGGDSAKYFDPYEVEDIKDKIIEGIEMSENKYQIWKSKSLAQSLRFSWDKAANETIKIYENL